MKYYYIILIFTSSLNIFAEDFTQNSDSIKIKKDLDEVVVTGQLNPVAKNNAVQDIIIVSNKTIKSNLFNNLGDLLKYQSNFNLSNDNILGSSILMQGVSGQNVKILIDGVPVIGRLNGNIDVSQLNLSNIDKIEIIKGPLSVNYGSDALAGTINLISKKVISNKLNFSFKNYYETVGVYNLDFTINFGYKKHKFSSIFQRNFFSGWSKNDAFSLLPQKSVADTNRFKEWNPKLQLSNKTVHAYKHKNLNIRSYGEYFYEKITNRGRPLSPYYINAFDDYYYTFRKNLGSKLIIKNEKYKIQSIIALNQFRRVKNTYYKNLITLSENLVDNSSDQDTSIFNMFMAKSWFSSKKKTVNYQIGLDIIYETASGQRIADNTQYQTDYSFFSNGEFNIKNLDLRPGLRVIYNTKYKAPLIPSLNLMLKLNENFQIRSSYAKGYRAPSLKELFFEFIDINHYIVGNPNLSAEKGDNYRFSSTYSIKNKNYKSSIKGSIFYNNIKDKIDLYNISDQYVYFNLYELKTIGGNIDISLLSNAISINTSLSHIGRSNKINSNDPFKYIFYSNYTLNCIYEINPQLTLNVFYKYNGEKTEFITLENDDIIETKQKAYNSLDISINQIYLNNKLKLSFGIKNLFDVTDLSFQSGFSVHSNSNNKLSIGYGRTYFSSLSINL